ncbi:TPA: glycogen synthesis protein GlgS [Citrobacter freundii]|nr:glycogen synthesis protein GlgS [Citrobacter freundii]EJF24010.1 glycogen synthesis protein GlgS [Citrobacter sp. A1]EKU34748.1 glycogen synthesis protein [Citrobacter sp. L17]KYC19271.1 glycogen synthesis protein GlgS [Citrobacter sp. AATXR]EKU4730608.1 glycogen synthesis protein GlgS [Citrobacter freundii]
MNEPNLNALSNFDFLARSFARMYSEGFPIDIKAITGNMSGEQKAWFCLQYERYCKQAVAARKKERH